MNNTEKQSGFTLIDKSVKANSIGFTLIELLVVTAILGILVGISSTVFVGILRSQNKTNATNEVRQNANLAIDLFERDIRSASSITGLPAAAEPAAQTVYFNSISVDLQDGGNVEWVCDTVPAIAPALNGNGALIRDTDETTSFPYGSATLEEQYVTNIDAESGVNIDCLDSSGNGAFQLTGGSSNQLVTLEFTAKQGVSAPARNDYQIELKFQTTLGTRNRN